MIWRENKGTEGVRKPILGGKMFVTKFHNKGAFLGAGEKNPQVLLGVSIGITLVCTVIFILTFGKHGKNMLKLGLSLLLGGAFSNTYDRLSRKYVVDYFGFNVKNEKLRNMIFNVSDFCILIGTVLTVAKV